MTEATIEIKETRKLEQPEVLALYEENRWSSAKKPDDLMHALLNSHSLVSAWSRDRLVGLGNAISDGYLVVYFPHLLVLPDFQGQGVGRLIMERMSQKYQKFHQQVLIADGGSVGFYEKAGFRKAGKTQAMWVYEGSDH